MKILKWILGIVVVLALLFYFVGMPYLKKQTKKNSPETTAVYTQDNMDLSVTYSSPFKKGRVIFGELVPYDKVWRTGANEATVFVSGTDIKIVDKELPAGTYSLWTKPGKDNWSVIFNSEIPSWGATLASGGKDAMWNTEYDVLQVEVPVMQLPQSEESFTIAFENDGQLYLSMYWDTTKIRVPINE